MMLWRFVYSSPPKTSPWWWSKDMYLNSWISKSYKNISVLPLVVRTWEEAKPETTLRKTTFFIGDYGYFCLANEHDSLNFLTIKSEVWDSAPDHSICLYRHLNGGTCFNCLVAIWGAVRHPAWAPAAFPERHRSPIYPMLYLPALCCSVEHGMLIFNPTGSCRAI